MLRVEGKNIIDKAGRKVRLTGISIGGWLMIEGYILGGRNIAEHIFKGMAPGFVEKFRKVFVAQNDAEIIKKLGFNCIRLPFNYRLLEEPEGFEFLKKAVLWFTERKMYVILDMHAVPGSQNQDWHSDSDGKALFFEDESHRKHYLNLWKQLSDAFKDNEYVAGYDVMNEPVTDKLDILKQAYKDVIDVIRKNGDQHIIFLEGNMWAQQVDFIPEILSENVAISIHFYEPTKFVFNQVSNLTYPGRIGDIQWNKARIAKYLKQYTKYGVPIYVGEFGIASRCQHCKKEYDWVRDVLQIFKQYRFHWTYWTYKSVGGMKYPDGLFQLFDQSDIIGLGTEHPGMENIPFKLKEDPQKVYDIFATDRFILNRKLMNIIKNYLC